MSQPVLSCLTGDPSDHAVGPALQQKVDNAWQLIAFFSKELTDTESYYSTFGRELYAAYSAVRHFCHLLAGRRFYILTDHRLLLGAFRAKADRYSPREIRHLGFLLQFTSDICHIKGEANLSADALSRSSKTLELHSDFDAQVIASEQLKDTQLQHFKQRTQHWNYNNFCSSYKLQHHMWYINKTTSSICTREK